MPNGHIMLMYSLQGAIDLCIWPKSPLMFSMYADRLDYCQWKTGKRASADTGIKLEDGH